MHFCQYLQGFTGIDKLPKSCNRGPLKEEMILISLPFFVGKSRVYKDREMNENRFRWHLGGRIYGEPVSFGNQK